MGVQEETAFFSLLFLALSPPSLLPSHIPLLPSTLPLAHLYLLLLITLLLLHANPLSLLSRSLVHSPSHVRYSLAHLDFLTLHTLFLTFLPPSLLSHNTPTFSDSPSNCISLLPLSHTSIQTLRCCLLPGVVLLSMKEVTTPPDLDLCIVAGEGGRIEKWE